LVGLANLRLGRHRDSRKDERDRGQTNREGYGKQSSGNGGKRKAGAHGSNPPRVEQGLRLLYDSIPKIMRALRFSLQLSNFRTKWLIIHHS